ncbi:hypothetical protein BDN67DRAFT_975676, partial [Paxillus ammoniavirescens]
MVVWRRLRLGGLLSLRPGFQLGDCQLQVEHLESPSYVGLVNYFLCPECAQQAGR